MHAHYNYPNTRPSRPEITVVSAQPMSGDIIPSPPMSPQYEQPSPPMTRRQIPPNRTVPDPRPPQPARPPSAPTRPSQPTRPTASVLAPPSRQPPASRPPPPQPTRKSPPAKPKPFFERKMPEEAAESPKTVPARPAARPPPPKPVSKSKKVRYNYFTPTTYSSNKVFSNNVPVVPMFYGIADL